MKWFTFGGHVIFAMHVCSFNVEPEHLRVSVTISSGNTYSESFKDLVALEAGVTELTKHMGMSTEIPT